MSGKPIVIFGLGELAEVAAYYFENDTERTVAAFTVDGDHVKEPSFLGHDVVPFEEATSRFPVETHDVFVAIGYSKINAIRQKKCEQAIAMGYSLASYVSSRATVFANVRYGWNSFILEDNTLQPFVRIGNGVTLWSGNHIGHHARIGDFAFISSHVVISGGCEIGANTFIGVNSTVNDHLRIGSRCVIGSGSLIQKDAEDESVFSAEPARLSPVPSSRLRRI